MGAENAPVVERTLNRGVGGAARHPKRDRPFRGVVFLRLHCTEPGHHRLGFAQVGAQQAVIHEPLGSQSRVHGHWSCYFTGLKSDAPWTTMAAERVLEIPSGYDAAANPRVTSFAAQLDDQLALLKKAVAGFDVPQLEWQPHPGINTVGMLLAHLAVVDVWWITIATQGIPRGPEAEAIFKRIIGIGMDDDGIPLAADGLHPESLRGKPLAYYTGILDVARASTHQVLKSWRDADIPLSYQHNNRNISREWTVYHVLEHFSGHYGQILLLMHLMRDAGILDK
jgi:uncharacterized damage-inducible protein DinB